MVAFTWSLTTVMTLFAFITAVVLTIQVHAHYRGLKRYYDGDDWYSYDDDNNNNNAGGGRRFRFLQGGEEGEGEEAHNSRDEYQNAVRESYERLANMSGIRSITFVAVYCMLLATGLCLYGSTAIVGFTSLRGVYISPCFDNPGNKLTVGIFGGAIVLFANLLLVCAVVLGEVRVSVVSELLVAGVVWFVCWRLQARLVMSTSTQTSILLLLPSFLLSFLSSC